MFSTLAIWLYFVACLLVILYSGIRLSRYGNLIAVRTGLGGTWVGVVLVAGVTSLPELVTGLSAIVVTGEPDLAVGDALGSCIYNLLIIAALDVANRGGSIYSRTREGHNLSAGFGVVMLGAVAAAMFLQQNFTGLRIGHIGPYTLAAPVLYALAMRSVFRYERRERETYAREAAAAGAARGEAAAAFSMKQIYARYAVHAMVLVGAATALPVIGDALATAMGWQQTFVGTILMALATSVPEIVISVEAVRIGAVDLAIGNVLGSNLFDLLILAADDAAFLDGPLLGAASGQHVFTAIAAVTMTGIVMLGLSYRPKTQVFRLVAWVSLALLAVAILDALVLFLLR